MKSVSMVPNSPNPLESRIANRVLWRTITSCLMTSVASVSLAGDLFQESLQPIFAENCAYCHGEGGEVNGGVDLFRIPNGDALVEDAKLLEKLIRVLEFRDMPPADEAELAESDRTRLLVALETLLTQSTASLHAGRDAPMRRMNRFQYNNAVVDLFDLNCVVFSLPERMLRDHNQYFQPATGAMPATVVVGSRPLGKSQMIEPRLGGVAAFPQDLRAENGFDNRGDHLSLSPLLMESFLKLSQSIMESPDFNARRVGIWNEFFRPLIMTISEENFTLPLGLVSLQGQLGTGSMSTILAGVVLSMIPALIVFIIGQRPLREGLTAGAVK